MSPPLLVVEDLRVAFEGRDGPVQAVDGVSFALASGEVLAIVGESGCGKSVTALTIMGLSRGVGARVEGRVRLGALDVVTAREGDLRRLRGGEIALVPQNPMAALNPVYRVGDQIVEQIEAHGVASGTAARERALDLLRRVGVPDPARRIDAFPHELSGGQRQRVMIAMALSCEPRLLIADEPTTALDVTVQAQILAELERLKETTGAGVIIATHDLAVVAEVADRVAVMYAGQIVEEGAVEEVFYDPQHPYTWGLLGSVPRPHRLPSEPLPAIPGAPPSLGQPFEGCRFRSRCPHEFEKCAAPPALEPRVADAAGRRDRCWLPPAEKRRRRYVSGAIGLEAGAAS